MLLEVPVPVEAFLLGSGLAGRAVAAAAAVLVPAHPKTFLCPPPPPPPPAPFPPAFVDESVGALTSSASF